VSVTTPIIRQPSVTDARAIAEIHVYSWQVAYRGLMPDVVLDKLSVDEREQAWLGILGANTRNNLVLEESGRIAGWAAFGPARDSDLDPQKVFELYGIYLHPTTWGRGLGRCLYEAAEECMKLLAVEHVVLWVLEKNARGRNFYEGAGFVLESGRLKVIEREGTKLPELRYQKNLK